MNSVDQQQEALSALRNGDIEGLAILVRLHQLEALRTAFAITGDRWAAEDIVSDAFIKVYKKIESYDPDRPFEPWLYRLVVHTAIDHSRKSQRWRRIADALAVRAEAGPTGDPELRLDVGRAVRALPFDERVVVALHYYLDMEERSMSEVLDCPVGTVKSRLHRARRRLRELLDENDESLVVFRRGQGGS